MLRKFEEIELIKTAKYIVASNGDMPLCIYFSSKEFKDALQENRYPFYDFFDEKGESMGGIKLLDEEDGLNGLYFEDEF